MLNLELSLEPLTMQLLILWSSLPLPSLCLICRDGASLNKLPFSPTVPRSYYFTDCNTEDWETQPAKLKQSTQCKE